MEIFLLAIAFTADWPERWGGVVACENSRKGHQGGELGNCQTFGTSNLLDVLLIGQIGSEARGERREGAV